MDMCVFINTRRKSDGVVTHGQTDLMVTLCNQSDLSTYSKLALRITSLGL